MQATGTFEIELAPQMEDAIDAGRILIEKQYQGDMQGKGEGQMLSKRTAVDGSAGYVAIETFTGTLQGLEGSFTLLHKGLMNSGEQSLDIVVVPDSGTGGFVGMSGSMQIEIKDGLHRYTFTYDLK